MKKKKQVKMARFQFLKALRSLASNVATSYRKFLLYEHFGLIFQNKLCQDCAVLKQVCSTPPPPSKSHCKNRMSPSCSLKAAQLLNCCTQRKVMGGPRWTAQMLLLLTQLLITSAVITCCFARHLE